MSENNSPDIVLDYTLDDIVQAAIEDPSWDFPEEEKGFLYMMETLLLYL